MVLALAKLQALMIWAVPLAPWVSTGEINSLESFLADVTESCQWFPPILPWELIKEQQVVKTWSQAPRWYCSVVAAVIASAQFDLPASQLVQP